MNANGQAKLLETILQNIPTAIEGLVQVKETYPEFISAFFKSSDPVIIISASAKKTQEPLKVVAEKVSEVMMLEVTGTPLESPITNEEMQLLEGADATPVLPQSERFEPINNTYARKVMQEYTREAGLQDDQLRKCVVFFVCGGKQENGNGEDFVLFGTETSGRMFANREEKCGETKMKQLRQSAQQKTLLHCGGKVGVTPNMKCVHFMEFNQSQLEKRPLDVNYFNITAMWLDAGEEKHLDARPPKNAVVTMRAQVVKCYSVPEIGMLHKEVLLLTALANFLRAPAASRVLNATWGDANFDARTLTEQLFNVSKQILRRLRSFTCPTTLESCVAVVNNQQQVDIDFTDLAWTSFTSCRNIEDVKELFINIMEQCCITKPYLQSNNYTKFATMLSSLQAECKVPILLHDEIVEVLLQLGCKKLCHDLTFICRASQLSRKEQVDQLCGSNIQDIQARVRGIQRVEQAIELVLQADKQYGCKHLLLAKLMDKALSESSDEIQVDVPAECLESFLEGSMPQLRRWTFKAENSVTGTCAVTHFVSSHVPVFHWADAKISRDDEDADSTIVGAPTYCATLYHIVNKKLKT